MIRCIFISFISLALLSCPLAKAQAQDNLKAIDSLKTLVEKAGGNKKVDFLNDLSKAYWGVSYKTALAYSSQAYDLAAELNYFEGMSDAANRTGNIYYFLRDTTRALEYYRKSLELARAFGSESRKGSIYNNLGALYANVNDFNKAIHFYTLALESKIKQNDNTLKSTLANFGWALYNSGEYTKALDYFLQYTNLLEELNEQATLAHGYNNIGATYLKLNKHNMSVDYYRKAYKIFESIADSLGMAQSFFNIGEALLQNNSLDGARIHLELSRNSATRLKNYQLLRDTYRELSLLYEKERNFKESWLLHTRFSNLTDSLRKAESVRLLEELKAIHETEQTANQADILTMESKIQKNKLRRETNFKTYLIISVLLLLLVAAIILSRFIIKQRLNKRLNEQIKNLQEANEKLEKSEENLSSLNITKDKFFGIIAHDLKNPFNALMGFSEMLSENLDVLTEQEMSNYVEIIHNSAKNLYRLLENLLLWSASQTGNISYAPENIDLRVLVQKEIALQKNAMLRKKIVVINKIAPGINVYVDTELISKTFNQLFDNAIKFSHEGGHITLSAVELKSYAEISIADTGPGMPEEQLQNLFRLDNKQSETNEQRGSGLGLILCKSFIERNSGFIDVISSPKRGTTFIISIPLAAKANKTGKL